MFLAADIGNTNVVLGFRERDRWNHLLRIETREPVEKHALRLSDFLLEKNIDANLIDKVALSSVVPQLTDPYIEILTKLTKREVYILGPTHYPKLPLEILNPQEIGTDLVANSLAAYLNCKEKCLVVDFGTALTFTTIDDNGKIVGVAIAPGLKTATRSLSTTTAKLPEIPLIIPGSVLGKDTVSAMQAGVLIGYTGLVEKMLATIKAEIGEPIKIFATGGLSSILTNIKYLFDKVDPDLTLNGLFEFHRLASND